MSLTVALNTAKVGLNQAERKIAVVAGNINNADKAGYTRKTLNTTYMFTGQATLPVGGKIVQAVANPQLVKQITQQATTASAQRTIATSLARYVQSFGSTADGAANLQSTLDDVASALQILAANPGDNSAKAKVITTASSVTAMLNSLSQAVQTQRLQANNDILSSVTGINNNLKRIEELNKQISTADANGSTTADLEDDRNIALQALSKELGVQYFINDKNQALVYSSGGSALVNGTGAVELSYIPVGVVTASTVYPGGFNGIMLNGVDITTTVQTGTLGALIELRDTTFPQEQSKLDMLSNTMQRDVNRIFNQGATYPPLQALTGTAIVTAGTAFSGTGNLRIAVTDNSGGLVNYADINLSSVTTVGGLMTALNAVPGVNASINADGKLVVAATSASNRISMNPLNSDVGGVSATQFFGFNDLFVNTATGANSIGINPVLSANYSMLATGTLSSSATLTAGDYVLSKGDASMVENLVTMLKTGQSFGTAGNFAARTGTFSSYAGSIISDAASKTAAANTNANTAEISYNYLVTNLANEAGVNIDEETANLTTLQTAYQANAQIISTVKSLFQTLMDSVR